MLAEVIVGASISLVLLVVLIGTLLNRAPMLFVADKLPDNLHSGADEVGELFTGSDRIDEAGPDEGEPNDYDRE